MCAQLCVNAHTLTRVSLHIFALCDVSVLTVDVCSAGVMGVCAVQVCEMVFVVLGCRCVPRTARRTTLERMSPGEKCPLLIIKSVFL